MGLSIYITCSAYGYTIGNIQEKSGYMNKLDVQQSSILVYRKTRSGKTSVNKAPCFPLLPSNFNHSGVPLAIFSSR